MNYRDKEKAKSQQILNDVIQAEGNGQFGGRRYGFVLDRGELNLWDGIREDALDYFLIACGSLACRSRILRGNE